MSVAEALMMAGMSEGEATRKESSFAVADGALTLMLGRSTVTRWRCFVPGRIEVLGKHTDYAGGRSLLCATERGICFVASARDDNRVRVLDAGRGPVCEFEVSADLQRTVGEWSNYPKTVVQRVARNFPGAKLGADIVFISDLVSAAGVSSSSALMIGIFAIVAEVGKLSERPEYKENIHSKEMLAAYLACIENGQTFGSLEGDAGVGTFGGSEDHTAILNCAAGELAQYSFCPTRLERRIALNEQWTFVVGASGVAASKTGNALQLYNRASLGTGAMLRVWNQRTGRNDANLAAAVRSDVAAVNQLREMLSAGSGEFGAEVLISRLEQFVAESERIVPAATEAVAKEEWQRFGGLVQESQRGAEELLGNQVPETKFLAKSASQLGAVAASAFGAGFGGSVWALVRSEEAERFREEWSRSYKEGFPTMHTRSSFYSTRPGPPLTAIVS